MSRLVEERNLIPRKLKSVAVSGGEAYKILQDFISTSPASNHGRMKLRSNENAIFPDSENTHFLFFKILFYVKMHYFIKKCVILFLNILFYKIRIILLKSTLFYLKTHYFI